MWIGPARQLKGTSMGYNNEYYFDARKLTSVSARYWSSKDTEN